MQGAEKLGIGQSYQLGQRSGVERRGRCQIAKADTAILGQDSAISPGEQKLAAVDEVYESVPISRRWSFRWQTTLRQTSSWPLTQR